MVKNKPGAKDGVYKELPATEKAYVIINSFLEVPYEEIGQVVVKCKKELIEEVLSKEGNQSFKEVKGNLSTNSDYSDNALYFILEYLKDYARAKGGNIVILKDTMTIEVFKFLEFTRTFAIGRIDAKNMTIYDYYGKTTDKC